jgi:hypothetical protein
MTDKQKMLRIYSEAPTVPVMGALSALGVALALRRGDPGVLALIALGWGMYIVQEHLVHRFIFHAPAPRRQFLFDILYRLHYGHHDQIKSRHLLFTPLWFALSLTLVNLAVLWPVMPREDVLIAVLGGGASAYLLFEWLHLTSHFATSSKGRLGRSITRRHAKHHHIDYENWYTVSPGGQIVDKVLAADPVHHEVVPNVRTCGLDPDDPRLVKSRTRFGTDVSLANKPIASVAG